MMSKELNLRLISAFPELESEYRAQTNWQERDETGSHVVYGDVLLPKILLLLKGKKFGAAKKYLDFIEGLIAEDDEYGAEVAILTVVEGIFYDEIDENEIVPLLGPETLEVWEEFKSHHQ